VSKTSDNSIFASGVCSRDTTSYHAPPLPRLTIVFVGKGNENLIRGDGEGWGVIYLV